MALTRKGRRQRGLTLLAGVLLIFLVGLGVLIAQRERTEEAQLDMRTLGRYGTRDPGFAVAVTPAAWERLWDGLVQKPDRPQVDFQREWVLAVFMGEKPTGGYAIDVESVTLQGREIRAVVSQKEPGPHDVVTLAFTYPGHVLALQRPGSKGTFRVVVVDGADGELHRQEVTF